MTSQANFPKTPEEIKALRLMDETFMSLVFQDLSCAQFLIRAILNKEDLVVTQAQLRILTKTEEEHPLRLDFAAHDPDGKQYLIGVQRGDPGDPMMWARYSSALLDCSVPDPGDDLEQLPENKSIFLMEDDYFERKLPVYHVERRVQELSTPFGDGLQILYVNGQYRGDDPIGSIMHDFFCADPAEMKVPLLAQAVAKYKNTEEGMDQVRRFLDELEEKSQEA